jgi:hypothetical protein
MGVIPVNINQTDPAHPNPNPVRCDRKDQAVQWTVTPPGAFAVPPIIFPPPPPGYDPLPKSAVWNASTLRLDLNDPLPTGQSRRYKYTVVMKNGQQFDPDIENTGSGGPADDKKKP